MENRGRRVFQTDVTDRDEPCAWQMLIARELYGIPADRLARIESGTELARLCAESWNLPVRNPAEVFASWPK